MANESNVSFIFDWNKRYDELSLFRITKDIPITPPEIYRGRAIGCLRYGAIDWQEELRMDSDWLNSLPTGRYHFYGHFWHSFDAYENEHDWGVDLVKLVRIR